MGCSVRLQQIVNKGKRGAAEYIKVCQSAEILYEILDGILSHEVNINDNESIDWVRWLMAGGYTPEKFTAIVKMYDNATSCGLVWNEQNIAYRCRTCSLTPCMSLCSGCFLNGSHEGHDYSMFHSETGGRCDCGDSSVMKSSGFCKEHGSVNNSKNMVPPPDLLYMPELMIPRIFYRLILHCRNYSLSYAINNIIKIEFDAENFLAMLYELSEMGAAMRSILTSVLISEDVYRKLVHCWSQDGSARALYMSSGEQLYKKALALFKNPKPPSEFSGIPCLINELEHTTFLQELVFWTVFYEFPQKLVNFLLVLLPDQKYKVALTEAFVLHYNCLTMMLERTSDANALSKRVANVSVQWLSNQNLTNHMAENFNLLEVMIVSVKRMISRSLVEVPANPEIPSEEKLFVVNCGSPLISQCRYWLFVSDLNTVFSHESLALKFMNDDVLCKTWFSFISYFQGMDVNERELLEHIEHEQDNTTVFIAELWVTLYPISSLISHLKDERTGYLSKKMIKHCLISLKNWLDSAAMSEIFDNDRFSFHIPLHRALAKLISRAVNTQKIDFQEILPQSDHIFSLLLHPLLIQVNFYEIMNGMWVRNGLQIKRQALTYTENNFCTSMVDADLYLLQTLATRIPSCKFMAAVIEKFRIENSLNVAVSRTTDNDQICEQNVQMLDSFLQFLAILCRNLNHLNVNVNNNDKLEMVTLLVIADRSHSEILDLMPELDDKRKSFDLDVILNEIADYKPPNFKSGSNMQQGQYVPKESTWEEMFDPIHVMYRTGITREDFQSSMDRFTTYVTLNKKLTVGATPWPPFRIPELCNSQCTDPRYVLDCNLFHAVVWIILYKYVHEKVITERILSLTVHLLEMALSVTSAETINTFQKSDAVDVVNLELLSWFPSNHLLTNVTTVIRNIVSLSSPDSSLSNVNESIISLLLKIHFSLTNSCDSFNTDTNKLNERIGDGKDFIEKVLIRMMTLSKRCRAEIVACQVKLKRTMQSGDAKQNNENDECEKKKKAEERRRKIMESFAKQQEKFAKENQKMLELESEIVMDWQDTSLQDGAEITIAEYYCGICKKLLPSTNYNPILLVTLAQATNVLDCKRRRFAIADEGVETSNKFTESSTHLEQDSSENSVNAGICVQTCGHYFDRKCLKISEERGRAYFCPVCRQFANGFLPILPKSINNPFISKADDTSQSIFAITNFINTEIRNDEVNSELTRITIESVENMEECLHFNSSSKSCTINLSLLTSIARTNLEIEIVLRGGSLATKTNTQVKENIIAMALKSSCIKPLLRVLAAHAGEFDREYVSLTWKQLTDTVKLPSSQRKFVPLLMRDPITLLIQFVLILPLDTDRSYFTLIVRFLYNLLYFRITTQLSCDLNEVEKNYFRNKSNCEDKFKLPGAMKFTIESLDTIQWNDQLEENRCTLWPNVEKMLEQKMRKLSLRFLRVGSLLRHHIYMEALPKIASEENEFDSLMSYLEIVPHDLHTKDQNSMVLLSKELNLIECWFEQFSTFATTQKHFSRNLISKFNVELLQPKLLPLPSVYDNIFKFYRNKNCNNYQPSCTGNSVCLVCGILVCLEKECCERNGVFEAVRHANDCGAGTGIFLNVPSSRIIIIRGRRACTWGSLYLDAYGEEDQYLKRGKPLFLSTDRYQLLEQQWLSHSFDHIDNKWILHNNCL